MKEISIVTLVAALGLLGSAAGVLLGGDQSLLVPSAEVVAENFARSLLAGREKQAARFAADEAPEVVEECSASAGRFYQPYRVDAEERGTMEDTATVEITIKSARGETSLDVELQWQETEWRVTKCSTR